MPPTTRASPTRRRAVSATRRKRAPIGRRDAPTAWVLAVYALVRDAAGRCLVLQRSRHSRNNPGKWDLPGGKVDPGEDFDHALHREVFEETQLQVRLIRLLHATDWTTPRKRVACLVMEAALRDGEIHLSAEHEAFRWVEPDELPRLDLAAHFVGLVRPPDRM